MTQPTRRRALAGSALALTALFTSLAATPTEAAQPSGPATHAARSTAPPVAKLRQSVLAHIQDNTAAAAGAGKVLQGIVNDVPGSSGGTGSSELRALVNKQLADVARRNAKWATQARAAKTLSALRAIDTQVSKDRAGVAITAEARALAHHLGARERGDRLGARAAAARAAVDDARDLAALVVETAAPERSDATIGQLNDVLFTYNIEVDEACDFLPNGGETGSAGAADAVKALLGTSLASAGADKRVAKLSHPLTAYAASVAECEDVVQAVTLDALRSIDRLMAEALVPTQG